jgi:G3E family GTPase
MSCVSNDMEEISILSMPESPPEKILVFTGGILCCANWDKASIREV